MHEVAAVHATTLLWAVNVRVQVEKRVITNGVAVIAIVDSSGSIEHDSIIYFRSHYGRDIYGTEVIICVKQSRTPHPSLNGMKNTVL